MNEVKELTVVEKDRMGLLADVSEALGKARVNIQTIFVDVTRGGQAVIHIVLKPRIAAKAVKALRKSGFKVMDSNVLVVRTRDKPGELSKLCRLLADHGINVTNAFSISRAGGEGLDAISTTDNEKARKLLHARKYL
ncbi:MAG: ACT domain-containing protein [Candidatus Norongarragalinales archaeon]